MTDTQSDANIAQLVIKAFGGPTKAAAAIGAPISTVDSWQRAGSIPAWRRPQVLKAAASQEIELPSEYVGRAA